MKKNNWDIVYRGSVKDIYQDDGKFLYFNYSDRYSIFDWGEMPDLLEKKGTCLALFADFFFRFLGEPNNWRNWQPEAIYQTPILEGLREKGLPHHSLGLVDDDLKPKKFGEVSHLLKVMPVQVLRPKVKNKNKVISWDYSAYESGPVQTLVPLEVIFRFATPKGSSLLNRLRNNPKYLEELNLKKHPKEGERFNHPIIEFSTKLEERDRYLTKAEAKKIAALTDNEWNKLEHLTKLIALRIRDFFSTSGIELLDGKFEFAFIPGETEREFMLVDSIGPDELRLEYKGVQLSKEVLRQFYSKSDWYKAVVKAKEEAEKAGEEDWKKWCIEKLKQTPSLLSANQKKWVEEIYPSLLNTLFLSYIGKEVMPAAGLYETSIAIKKLLKEVK